jgi:tetratricopeptide (TPR) repeat protein
MNLGRHSHDTPSCPYVGPRPYRAAERHIFFGRTEDALAIASLWSHNRLTVIHGQAGVGKSSLINAAVVPLLDNTKFNVLPMGRVTTRRAFPIAAQFEHNPYMIALLSSWAPGQTVNQLSRTTVSGFIGLQRRYRRSPLIAAIDQFEELLRGGSDRQADRTRFLEALLEALQHHPDLHLLIITREEYYTGKEFTRYLNPDAEFEVSALSRQAAIDAVCLPLSRTRRTFTPAAAEFLVDQLSVARIERFPSSHKAPETDQRVNPTYLQIACLCLWEVLPAHLDLIEVTAIKQFLDLDKCISEFISHALIRIAWRYNLDVDELAAWLIETFSDGDRISSTAIASSAPELINLRVVQALEDGHILCSAVRSGSLYYELVGMLLIFPLRLASKALETASGFAAIAINAVDLTVDAIREFGLGELDVADRIASYALQFLPTKDRRRRAELETLLGNLAYLDGDFRKSQDFYTKSAELFEAAQDQHSVGQLLAAIGSLQMRDWDLAAAIGTLQSAVTRLPTENGVKIELARAFARSGEPNAAIAVLKSVPTTKADAGGGDARILRGEILSDIGDSVRAIRDLDVLPLESVPSVRAARALTLARLGRFSDAEMAIEKALEAGHESGPVLLRAAQIRLLHGDRVGALSLVREALTASEPKLSEYQHRQASALCEQDDV